MHSIFIQSLASLISSLWFSGLTFWYRPGQSLIQHRLTPCAGVIRTVFDVILSHWMIYSFYCWQGWQTATLLHV